MHKITERKKTLIIYSIIFIAFLFFSIYMFSIKDIKDEDNSNLNKVNSVVEEKESNPTYEKKETLTYSELYESDAKNIVEKFIYAYHVIGKDQSNQIKEIKNILTTPLYNIIQNEIVSTSQVKTNGYVYRNIEELHIVNFEFDEETKDISLVAKVRSTWSDNDKHIVKENEMSEYNFLITNEMGSWKISDFSVEVL